VAKCFADDKEWRAELTEMLARREANEEKYASFQRREQAVTGVLDQIRLADAVMIELDDPSYARKLLDGAEQQWAASGFDPSEAQTLITAVDRHLGAWSRVERLVEAARTGCAQFAPLRSLVRFVAISLSDRRQAVALARRCYENWQQSLEQAPGSRAYDFSKLARVVERDLGDRDWAAKLLAKAGERGGIATCGRRLVSTPNASAFPNSRPEPVSELASCVAIRSGCARWRGVCGRGS